MSSPELIVRPSGAKERTRCSAGIRVLTGKDPIPGRNPGPHHGEVPTFRRDRPPHRERTRGLRRITTPHPMRTLSLQEFSPLFRERRRRHAQNRVLTGRGPDLPGGLPLLPGPKRIDPRAKPVSNGLNRDNSYVEPDSNGSNQAAPYVDPDSNGSSRDEQNSSQFQTTRIRIDLWAATISTATALVPASLSPCFGDRYSRVTRLARS